MISKYLNVPHIGDGATIYHLTDNDPYTVIEVSDFGRECKLRPVRPMLKPNDPCSKVWYEEIPEAHPVTLRKGGGYGWYIKHVNDYDFVRVLFGVRDTVCEESDV